MTRIVFSTPPWFHELHADLIPSKKQLHSGFVGVRNIVGLSDRRIFILAATHLAVIPLQVCLIFAIIKKCQLIHLALLFILLKL